jgi:hypothetical protein
MNTTERITANTMRINPATLATPSLPAGTDLKSDVWPGQPHRTTHGADITVPPRFAGLVDIEDTLILRDHLLPSPQLRDTFDTLDAHLVDMPVRVASGPRVVKACMTELASRGWGLTLISAEPDAADRALIEAGRHLAACGVTDLVVVSGDHVFATLAGVARLHVIAHPEKLSRALRLAATSVRHLPSQTPTQAIA